MKKGVLHLLVLSALTLIALPAFASQTVGTISNAQYSWGENLGWINFAPTTGGSYSGLTVTDSAVTGYAWSATAGWINFNPTHSGQGVTNTSSGQLGGSAWVAGLGWLPMNGVTINASGKFTGIAGTQGSTVGRLSFDCDQCNVVTDWRPLANRTVQEPIPAISTPQHSSGLSNPLIAPQDRPVVSTTQQPSVTSTIAEGAVGNAALTTSDGRKVTVDFPAGTFGEGVVITITPELLTPDNAPSPNVGALLVGGDIFNIVAKDQHGNIIHNLGKTITITIELPKNVKDLKDLSAYYLDESKASNLHWKLIKDAVFKDGKVMIQVNHLTRFTVFGVADHPDTLTVGPEQKAPLTLSYSWWAIISLILLFLVVFGVSRYRGEGRV